MKHVDLWFTRIGNKYYAATAEPGEAPVKQGIITKHPVRLIRKIKSKGIKIVQIGICTPDMLGIDSEV